MKRSFVLAVLVLALCLLTACDSYRTDDSLVNVSYDPTREFYEAYNELFAEHYFAETGRTIEVLQSHGGSGAQARSVIEGVDADVVTLALARDITRLVQYDMVDPAWMSEFPGNSAPYTSTIVFLVRTGNPKDIQNWDDLSEEDVDIIAPDPKSSGAACWNFLAAWYWAELEYDGDVSMIRSFMSDLYGNVLVMDSGARGSTTTFVENGQGDVLISWENEAMMILEEYPGEYELVSPGVSILAEPSVAVVDENVEAYGTEEAARMYLSYLYSEEAQVMAGEYGYRPSDPAVLAQFGDKFDLDMELCSIDDFGGWEAAYDRFFTEDGVFDQIYRNE